MNDWSEPNNGTLRVEDGTLVLDGRGAGGNTTVWLPTLYTGDLDISVDLKVVSGGENKPGFFFGQVHQRPIAMARI